MRNREGDVETKVKRTRENFGQITTQFGRDLSISLPPNDLPKLMLTRLKLGKIGGLSKISPTIDLSYEIV